MNETEITMVRWIFRDDLDTRDFCCFLVLFHTTGQMRLFSFVADWTGEEEEIASEREGLINGEGEQGKEKIGARVRGGEIA